MKPMQNKRTTILGYLTLGTAVLGFAIAFLGGADMETALKALALAIPGAGLVAASDGGH